MAKGHFRWTATKAYALGFVDAQHVARNGDYRAPYTDEVQRADRFEEAYLRGWYDGMTAIQKLKETTK